MIKKITHHINSLKTKFNYLLTNLNCLQFFQTNHSTIQDIFKFVKTFETFNSIFIFKIIIVESTVHLERRLADLKPLYYLQHVLQALDA